MTPTNYLLAGADLVAITALVAVFLGRHGRRDLVVAFLGVNVGVLAVATALGTGTIGAGLGLGLFGVLSIIRLRSEELTQSEIAYYFGALALGLLGGIAGGALVYLGLNGYQASTLNWASFSQITFAFTVTPRLATSAARLRVIPSSPAFAAA